MSATDIVLIIGAVFLGIVNVINAWQTKRIHALVNSTASALARKLEAVEAENASLVAVAAQNRETAALLAQALALATSAQSKGLS